MGKGNVSIGSLRRYLLSLLLLLILLEGSYGGFKYIFSSSGYSTGYQGARATFAGVEYDGGRWDSTGKWTTPGGVGSVLSFSFDTNLLWDPDERGKDKPAVAGEQTAVFIPLESVSDQPTNLAGYDITTWLLGSTAIRNPINIYEWELPIENNQTAVYRMEEWQLKWYFGISCEPAGDEVLGCAPYQNKRNYLTDVKVWFKFDLTPVWYFEGTDKAYFAIAKVRVSDLTLGGKLTDSTYTDDHNKEIRVTPMSKGSLLPIYYGLFGSEANRADKEPYEYQGKKLNPDLFTDTVYSYFTLNDFGVCSSFDWGTKYKADAVTVGLDVHIFVVGEWDVQDVQEIDEGETGRDAKVGGSENPFGWLFNDPYGRMVLLAIGVVVLFLFLAMFAPWVLILIFGLMSSFNKGARSRKGG